MDWLILVLSLVAGVAGTGFGGIIGALLKNRGTRTMGRVLGFAGGVMAGVVSFEMIPEAIASIACVGKISGIAIAVATTVGGMAVIFAVGKVLDCIEKKKRGDTYRVAAAVQAAGGGRVSTVQSAVSGAKAGLNAQFSNINRRNGEIKKARTNFKQSVGTDRRGREMIKAGTVMLIAIALHNFPEGMAIGASGTLETGMGVLIALIIAVHNIPEGMAISAPLVSGGVSGIKAVLLTALAGGATVIGALLGLAVGGLGELATGICLALASGAMLYVTFCDILPQSLSLNGEIPSVSMLAGLIFSIIFVFAF